jgi:undecaprenyl-diphosphatase
VAVVLGRRWRRGIPGLVVLAATVAFSRLYLDRHWLTDVLAGALLGALLAFGILAWWGARRRTGEQGA